MARARATRKRVTARSTTCAGNFAAVFAHLRQILERHVRHLFVKSNKPGDYYLETVSPSYRGQRLFFGGVQVKKNYVSFQLMPVYVFPELLKGISPELKKRMQGKSCFNFAAPDEKLFGELAKLTEAGFRKFRSEKLL